MCVGLVSLVAGSVAVTSLPGISRRTEGAGQGRTDAYVRASRQGSGYSLTTHQIFSKPADRLFLPFLLVSI